MFPRGLGRGNKLCLSSIMCFFLLLVHIAIGFTDQELERGIANRLLLALLIIKITKMMMTCRIARAMHVDTVTALMYIAFFD